MFLSKIYNPSRSSIFIIRLKPHMDIYVKAILFTPIIGFDIINPSRLIIFNYFFIRYVYMTIDEKTKELIIIIRYEAMDNYPPFPILIEQKLNIVYESYFQPVTKNFMAKNLMNKTIDNLTFIFFQ